MSPSLQSDHPNQKRALPSTVMNAPNDCIGATSPLLDNSASRSCPMETREPRADYKKIPASTASSSSTTTWGVTDEKVPTLPSFHPLGESHMFLLQTSASTVASRVAGALRAHSIESKFYSEQAKAECRTTEGSVFHIHLYRGRGKLSDGIILEIQRICGCARNFRTEATFILDACLDAKGKRQRPKIPSLLRSKCHFDDFEEITKRCESHPQEALHVDSNGWLPLHWVAGAASTSSSHAEAIESLLDAYPDAAGMTDSEGRTPLHHACKFGLVRQEKCRSHVGSDTTYVFDLLVKACPPALSMKDNCGFAPLNYAIKRHPSISVLRSLLSPNPKSGLVGPVSPKFGPLRSPLQVAWDDVISYKEPWVSYPERWKVAMLLLKAAYLGTTDFRDDNDFSEMIHAAVTFHLPPKTIDYALEFHHDALSTRDSHTGLYPFMLAAANNTGGENHNEDSELCLLNASFNLLILEPSAIKQFVARPTRK